MVATASTPVWKSMWSRLENKWDGIQVGRQGSYSIERLESLDNYCKTTSLTRVICICILTPLPALTVAVLLECLPLRPPSEGWARNWMFWIRFGLMVVAITFVTVSQLDVFAPGLNFTLNKRLIVTCSLGVAQVVTFILVAKFGAFPVPFLWQLGSIPVSIYLPTMIRIALGPAPFEFGSPVRAHLIRYHQFFVAHMGLLTVFPLCKILYSYIPKAYRGSVILMLPIWKFASKHVIVHATRELEDFMPELVALSVDYFSALFICVCMSTSGSISLSILFMAADVGQALLEFREVREHSITVLQLLEDARASRTSKDKRSFRNSETSELLAIVLATARNPRAYGVVSLKEVRLWGSPPRPITDEMHKRLRILEGSGVYGLQQRHSSGRQSQSQKAPETSRRIQVMPDRNFQEPSYPNLALQQENNETDLISEGRGKRIVLQGTQLLFHCEYLALVEYIECVIPLIYMVYKSVLSRLPNAAYFPDAGNWGTTAVTNLLVFSTIEVGSFIFFNALVQRKFGFSPLYQVAFVLETQFAPVQAKLFLETIFLLQYELQHLGADFTFQFEWLRSQAAV